MRCPTIGAMEHRFGHTAGLEGRQARLRVLGPLELGLQARQEHVETLGAPLEEVVHLGHVVAAASGRPRCAG